ncbi:hypothetical protein BGX30_007425 [Mortierella sp. GBA39]|nr:hypothetical protein BGX30_007425 [Mortierella sp. GBA39]
MEAISCAGESISTPISRSCSELSSSSPKTNAGAATAATNAITILVQAGVRFNSIDLRGIRIPRADLSDSQFDSAQLQGDDLTDVNFARSWLRQVDFGNAQMDGVWFEEMSYLH